MDMARGASMELELLPPLRTATTCGVIRLLLVMESISLTLAVDPLSPSLSSTLELLPLKLELPPLMELVMVMDMDMERGASMELELLPPWRTATTCGVIRLLLVMESISLTLAVDPLSPHQ